MAQRIFFIFISSAVLQTHSADEKHFAVLPNTVTALTGSCVQIPCTFNISRFEEKLNKSIYIYGIWLKNKSQYAASDSFIAFNSSENIIRGFGDIQMTGDLKKRNCTTVFFNIMKNHSDVYYFRLEMEPEFSATFNVPKVAGKTVRITAIDSPQPPEFKPNNLSYVMEGSPVTLSCSAEAPCPKQPPTISWSNISESANITTQLQEKPDKTQSVFSLMSFTASYRDHRKNISCTATYPRNTPEDSTVETTVTLRVLFAPKETHIIIRPSASVSVGTNATLICKTKASPSNEINYTWYKRGQKTPIDWGKTIHLIVTRNKTGSYFCTAQNKHGNQSSADIQLTDEGQVGFSRLVIYGCTGGFFVFALFAAVIFYWMRTKTSSQAQVTKGNQAADTNRDMVAIYENNAITINQKSEKTVTDDLHYGEIDFSKLQTDHVTRDCSNTGPQAEYSELRMTERMKQMNGFQQTDSLYAQIQEK